MAIDASPACPQTFHQAFEGLGLGARLTFLRLPPSLGWVPFTCAAVYACATPLGMVVGLSARSLIDMSSTSATVVEGVLDSISAGILAYSACVQLIAQEVCSALVVSCTLLNIVSCTLLNTDRAISVLVCAERLLADGTSRAPGFRFSMFRDGRSGHVCLGRLGLGLVFDWSWSSIVATRTGHKGEGVGGDGASIRAYSPPGHWRAACDGMGHRAGPVMGDAVSSAHARADRPEEKHTLEG
jgi:hypothetical protein